MATRKIKNYIWRGCIISLPGNAGPYARLLLKSKALGRGYSLATQLCPENILFGPGQCSKSLLFRCSWGCGFWLMLRLLSPLMFFYLVCYTFTLSTGFSGISLCDSVDTLNTFAGFIKRHRHRMAIKKSIQPNVSSCTTHISCKSSEGGSSCGQGGGQVRRPWVLDSSSVTDFTGDLEQISSSRLPFP